MRRSAGHVSRAGLAHTCPSGPRPVSTLASCPAESLDGHFSKRLRFCPCSHINHKTFCASQGVSSSQGGKEVPSDSRMGRSPGGCSLRDKTYLPCVLAPVGVGSPGEGRSPMFLGFPASQPGVCGDSEVLLRRPSVLSVALVSHAELRGCSH